MSLLVPNIIDLPYPMFKITKQEKAILIKAKEFYNKKLTGKHIYWGLCEVVDLVSFDGERLRHKISKSLGPNNLYLHWYLTNESEELDIYIKESFVSERYELYNRLRLVWITKLLNQDVL